MSRDLRFHPPTVEEYARMSWYARQRLFRPVEAAIRDQRRRDAESAAAVRAEAERLLASGVFDPPEVTAARRAELAAATKPRRNKERGQT